MTKNQPKRKTMCLITSPLLEGPAPAPTHRRCSRHKKQVRFQEEKLEELYEIEISDQERRAKWMTRADFLAIHADVRRAAKEYDVISTSTSYYDDLTTSSSDDEEEGDFNDQDYFRGLETIFSSHRRIEVHSFIQDLLKMQEDYRYLGGLLGSKGLQYFSENNSRIALQRAQQMADRDAFEARRVYAERLSSRYGTMPQ